MNNSSVNNSSDSPARRMELARARLPRLVTQVIMFTEEERRAAIANLAPSVLSRLPDEVFVHLLDCLAAPHECVFSPGDQHVCHISCGPVLYKLRKLGQAAKALYLMCMKFRQKGADHFRQGAARLEFDYWTMPPKDPSWFRLSPGQQEELGKEYETTVRDYCRSRYDLDPVPSPSENIPQTVHANLIVGGAELAEMKVVDMTLDEGSLAKHWVPGKHHTLFMPSLYQLGPEGFFKAGQFLAHQAKSLISLDLGNVPDFDHEELESALAQCVNLKHLAIRNCSLKILDVIWDLPKLVSLKLEDSAFDPDIWSSPERAGPDALPCPIQYLVVKDWKPGLFKSILCCLPKFFRLRELRLDSAFYEVQAQDIMSLCKVLKDLPAFESLELRNLDSKALAELPSQLPRKLERLSLVNQDLSDAQAASLVRELDLSNALVCLQLRFTMQDASAKALQAWLEQPDCSLRTLRLHIELKDVDVDVAMKQLLDGLCANRSLRTLEIRFTEETGSSDSDGPERPESKNVGMMISKALPEMSQLLYLTLDGKLSEERYLKIALTAFKCNQLLELHLKGGQWSLETARVVLETLKSKNSSLLDLEVPALSFPEAGSEIEETEEEQKSRELANHKLSIDMQERFRRALMANRMALPQEEREARKRDVTVTSTTEAAASTTTTTTTSTTSTTTTTGITTTTSTGSSTSSATGGVDNKATDSGQGN